MHEALLFSALSSLSIASPGPGIMFTITNALNYSLRHAISGFTGIAVGMGIISLVAVSSLGVMISSSHYAFITLKVLGALYFFYLGLKKLKQKRTNLNGGGVSILEKKSPRTLKIFLQGMSITLINPKPIIFFMAVLPQFVDVHQEFLIGCLYLTVIFCSLIIVIHSVYAFTFKIIRGKFYSESLLDKINKLSGLVFVFFSIGLIISITK